MAASNMASEAGGSGRPPYYQRTISLEIGADQSVYMARIAGYVQPDAARPIYVISFRVTYIKASHAFFTGFPAFFLGERPLTFYVLLCETHPSSCHGERLSTREMNY